MPVENSARVANALFTATSPPTETQEQNCAEPPHPLSRLQQSPINKLSQCSKCLLLRHLQRPPFSNLSSRIKIFLLQMQQKIFSQKLMIAQIAHSKPLSLNTQFLTSRSAYWQTKRATVNLVSWLDLFDSRDQAGRMSERCMFSSDHFFYKIRASYLSNVDLHRKLTHFSVRLPENRSWHHLQVQHQLIRARAYVTKRQ